MKRRRRDEAGSDELAELAALADGSLAPERRAALEARVAADSPELADRLAEQQRAVALARSAAAEVEAPPALRARVEAQRAAAPRADAPRPLVVAVAVARGAGGRRRARAWLGSGTSGEQLPRRPRAHRARPGRRAATRRSPRRTRAGGSSSTPRGCRAARAALFYQAWLRNAAGVLVPIGTFNEGRNVTLWAGVSPKDYPT